MAKINRCFTTIMIAMLKTYQWLLRPILGQHCRFQPSCSDYALEAAQQYGPASALWLTIRRLFRCHPFCPGGFDPVPELNKVKNS